MMDDNGGFYITFDEGSLEVKLPTIWTDEKTEVGRVREEKSKRKKIRKEKSQKTEDAGAWKGRKVEKHCVFPMVCGSGGSTSRLAKAASAEPCGQMRDAKLHAAVAQKCAKHISKSKCTKHLSFRALVEAAMSKKCTPLWREAHFEVKTYKTHYVRTTFGSWDVEKVHALVARSTFRSQNVKSTTCSDHFWMFRCRLWIVHLVKSEQNVRVF